MIGIAKHEIEFETMRTGELKRFAVIKGNAGTPEMIKIAQQRGYDTKTDADLLLEQAKDQFEVPVEPDGCVAGKGV